MGNLIMNMEEIKKWFDSDKWDIGYLTKEQLKICSQTPVKTPTQFHGWSYVNDMHYDWRNICNGLVIIKYSSVALDYSLYEEATEILNKQGLIEFIDWGHVYTNFKEAEILSGRGVRARNSLVYNRKFGFQCKLCAYMFVPPIVNYEKLEPSTELLDLCEGCDDCIRNCPVGAIHEDHIEMYKCGAFMVCGNHPTITSKKWFWYEKMKPNYTREEIESLEYHPGDDLIFNQHKAWGKGVDGFYEMSADGVELKKDGVTIGWPHCKECQKQPRCSKAPVFSDDK